MFRRSLIRMVRFRATHHYRVRGWDAERNRQAFGAQAEPHEHEYAVEVTVAGPPDPVTGFVTDLGQLDGVLHDEIVGPLDGRDLNRVIPEVAEGAMQPSTEALAEWVFRRVAPRVADPARVIRVRVWESDELAGQIEVLAGPDAAGGRP
ncbi:MAG: 6-carboxytetrahydropterin synthase [Gemmatimonadales bacterium]|nr:MAG: 6-carboxytetrahydropterin synthase [Gemmatimonadales bacterium]